MGPFPEWAPIRSAALSPVGSIRAVTGRLRRRRRDCGLKLVDEAGRPRIADVQPPLQEERLAPPLVRLPRSRSPQRLQRPFQIPRERRLEFLVAAAGGQAKPQPPGVQELPPDQRRGLAV
jgi:hypothetical protein